MLHLKPIKIGQLTVERPLILAPMAGITDLPFRKLCRELELKYTGKIAGLYVCEMITARALLERNQKTMHLVSFDEDESIRSMQLYSVDPQTTYDAVKMVVEENLADHIDMNFGCPVPKVTRKGGGAALPYKRRLFQNIITAAVKASENSNIPITVKFRSGIDDTHLTYIEAGKIAFDAGASAITLHARTAEQFYSGKADWSKIAKLKETISDIPVFGNGDIFTFQAAQKMVEETGCDGIVIGRGCLGRPWLFAEIITNLMQNDNNYSPPNLEQVMQIARRHAKLLVDFNGDYRGIRQFRKHVSWYLHGFPAGPQIRNQLGQVNTLAELDKLIAKLPLASKFPAIGYSPRGRQSSQSRVQLPSNWLDDPQDLRVPYEAEMMHSGG